MKQTKTSRVIRAVRRGCLLSCLLGCLLTWTACDILDELNAPTGEVTSTDTGVSEGETQAPNTATDEVTEDSAAVTEAESEAHTHTMSEWITVKEPTTEEFGVAQRYCTVCGHTESTLLDRHVHAFGEWNVTEEPTCDKPGVEARLCACGEREERTVDPQHKLVEEAYETAPTCVSAGEKSTEVCSVCGYRAVEIVGVPLGHRLSDGESGHLHCDTCGVTTHRIYDNNNYSWKYFYTVYGSYETWEDNMSPELAKQEYYDVLVPRHDYITSILPTLFKGSHVQAITMTDNIVSIEKFAFEECRELTYVRLPSSIQKIHSRAFADCDTLTFIQYEGTMAEWRAVEKAADWDEGAGLYTVICSDGVIEPSAEDALV